MKIDTFKHCNHLTAIPLGEYLALPEYKRCDYFVSNTILINSALAGVIFNDLYRQHGKYSFKVPNHEEILQTINIGFAIQEKISLFISLDI